METRKNLNHTYTNLYSLQILRSIAATSVVIVHAAGGVFGGFGVDIFFVISGFVMALIIANGTNAIKFGIGRVARILPLYWLVTSILFILILYKPGATDLPMFDATTTENYLKSIFFIPYLGASDSGIKPILGVGWTLNYEMLFYMCIFLCLTTLTRHVVSLTTILLVAIYSLSQLSDNKIIFEFHGSLIIFEFILGFLAFSIFRLGVLKYIPFIVYVFTCILTYALMVYSNIALEKDPFLLIAISSFLLVISFVALENKFNPSNLVTILFAKLGDASYSTYLTHWFSVVALININNRLNLFEFQSLSGVIITVIIALIVGQITYIIADKPLHLFSKRLLTKIFIKPTQ